MHTEVRMRGFYHHTHILLYGLLFLLLSLLASGCSVKFVSDYDAATYEEILRVGKEVDKFYGNLLEKKDSERAYAGYSSQYVQIESDLRSLYTRNKSRPLNKESTKISESILKLWVKYKDKHKANNTYKTGNARLDRNRFVRLFLSAASAEAAKNLNPDDADASKDSQATTAN